MLFEQIAAEIVAEIAPDGVDVIAVTLRFIELYEEIRGLDAVIVGLQALGAAGPREPDAGAGLFDLRLT